MDRRDFLKRIVAIVAAAVTAPLALVKPVKRGWYSTKWSAKIMREREAYHSILPDTLRVNEEHFKFLEYLRATQAAQLGVRDLTALSKAKRYGSA